MVANFNLKFSFENQEFGDSEKILVNAPSKSAYSRFVKDLEEVCPNIDEWIQTGIAELYELLPD
ncbi:hypothetical protein E5983_08805 [Streptococcus danieliae]|uniref:Uncharacterized protein n=1 Tax=Streptococcus danieliae TaxID=747656 RepID=A0A7X3GB44_9STRE|nr:hypothetical protein [Streptococcus danieliae]